MKVICFVTGVVGVILLSWAVHAQYEGWEHFYTNLAGDRFYYDPNSVVSVSKTVSTVRIKGSSARENTTIKTFEQLLEIDCNKRMYRKLESQITRHDGSVYTEAKSNEWSQVLPDSSMESLLDKACPKTRSRRGR
jgi:hypothetical protein